MVCENERYICSLSCLIYLSFQVTKFRDRGFTPAKFLSRLFSFEVLHMESRSSWPNCVLVSLAAMVGTWWCFLPASVSTNYHFESLRPNTQGQVSFVHIVTGFSQLIFLIVNICQNVPKMAYYYRC